MTETIQLRVHDFDCPTCADTIERALTALEGVRAAEVHFATGRIEVEYESTVTDRQTIEGTIQKRGYSPQPA